MAARILARGYYGTVFNRHCVKSANDIYRHCQSQIKLFTSGHRKSVNTGLIKSVRWFHIPLSLGIGYVCYMQFRSAYDPEIEINPAKDWQINFYRSLPLRSLSRFWGYINEIELPVWLRKPLLSFYAWLFKCDLQEAAIEDLHLYLNLGDFFRRKLKPSARLIDSIYPLVCPCDGTVLCFGQVQDNWVEQIKGRTFSLTEFLGPITWKSDVNTIELKNNTFQQFLLNDNKKLYYCIIYLSPGSYHGFHSPADWNVLYRRHFPGDLLSVSPKFCKKINRLFNFNERAVYFGRWEHGFFSLAAVGATNVGSIKIYFDEVLKTNLKTWEVGTFWDCNFKEKNIFGITMKKGESFGEFNLGSTIIIIFEAPVQFTFKIVSGQIVKMGQALGQIGNTKIS